MLACVGAMPPATVMLAMNLRAAFGIVPLCGTPTIPTWPPGFVTFRAVESDWS